MTDPMSDERLAEIHEREQAASPGPWQAVGHSHIEKGCRCLSCWATTGWVLQHQLDCEEAALAQQRADSEPEPSETCECAVFSFADVDFIERAREDVPALLAEVERLRAEMEETRDTIADPATGYITRLAKTEAERDAARAEVEQWRATFGESALRDGLARMARIEAERDEARAELAGYQRLSTSPTRDDLTGLETLCAFLHASGEADPNVIKDVAWRTFALIRAYREREAERDEAREQVKRVADEAEARAAKKTFNDPYEYGQAIGLRAVAAGLREVLDGTEPGQ